MRALAGMPGAPPQGGHHALAAGKRPGGACPALHLAAGRRGAAALEFAPRGKSPLCGNRLCQGRRFFTRGTSALEACVYYHTLDAGSIKGPKRWREHFPRLS